MESLCATASGRSALADRFAVVWPATERCEFLFQFLNLFCEGALDVAISRILRAVIASLPESALTKDGSGFAGRLQLACIYLAPMDRFKQREQRVQRVIAKTRVRARIATADGAEPLTVMGMRLTNSRSLQSSTEALAWMETIKDSGSLVSAGRTRASQA